ncbi:hypothetical protein AKJ16_DCAP23447 [Drosera capensis]
MAAPRTVAVWRRRLGAALRIAFAYGMIGCVTLYGPEQIRNYITYSAFSYLTGTLIVSEATLGDAVRGTWHVIIGTCLVMGPSILSLWLVGPGRFNPNTAAIAVGLGAFWIALPDSIPLMSKRIAFGELVIVYVGTVINGASTDVVMHPVNVAASAGLGALASVIAMLLPFPHLAVCEVTKKCEQYAENATDRMNLYMKAIVAEESTTVLELAAEAKTLSESAAKLLHFIKKYQGGMLWEMPHLRLVRPDFKHPAEKLQEIEVSLRGMEMALTSRTQKPKDAVDEELKDELKAMAKQLTQKLEQNKVSLPFSSSKVHDQNTSDDSSEKNLLPLNICHSQQHLSLSFFFFCMKHLNQEESSNLLQNNEKPIPEGAENHSFGQRVRGCLPSHNSLAFAVKCSLSLGLSVLLGLTYNKDAGYWAGLAIAVSFVTTRQATFWGSNARVQGTALGSIYGLLGYFICNSYTSLRLAFLLPWIVFTTFLRHSKMYGEAGSISAVVAALLVLGREGYGTPTEFAISRTVEACIGLFCFILVEVLLQPERAASLSKEQLSQCFGTINSFIGNIVDIQASHNKLEASTPATSIKEDQAKLKVEINQLRVFIEEAKTEPNFWFAPFQGDSYTALQKSINKIADLSSFIASAVVLLDQEMEKSGDAWKDNQEQISIDIELFKNKVSISMEHLEKATSTDHVQQNEKDQQTADSTDLEMGKQQNGIKYRIPTIDEEETENILSAFLQHTRDVTDSNRAAVNAEVRNKMLLSLGCMGFCMRSLVTEVREVHMVVRELIRK